MLDIKAGGSTPGVKGKIQLSHFCGSLPNFKAHLFLTGNERQETEPMSRDTAKYST
jgi:hypothetical protein